MCHRVRCRMLSWQNLLSCGAQRERGSGLWARCAPADQLLGLPTGSIQLLASGRLPACWPGYQSALFMYLDWHLLCCCCRCRCLSFGCRWLPGLSWLS